MKKSNITKTAKKISKPLYTVDLTDIDNELDVHQAFAIARFEAGVGLSESDRCLVVDAIANQIVEDLSDTIENCGNFIITMRECVEEKEAKKPNIFRRFWNWVTGK